MRTASQIHDSAAAMQRCLDRGLPGRLLVALVVARRALAQGRRVFMDDELREALSHPAAAGFDDMLAARLRRGIR